MPFPFKNLIVDEMALRCIIRLRLIEPFIDMISNDDCSKSSAVRKE